MNDQMEDVAARIRRILVYAPNTSEKRMFGGVCFLLNGNMLCAANRDGRLMLRVGKEREAEARAKPLTSEMNFTGRKMGGFIYVEPEGFGSDTELEKWIAFATHYVGTLHAK